MSLKHIFIVFLSILLLAGCRQRTEQIPVDDFFAIPEKTNYKISPNGKYIAYLGESNEQKNIYVIDLDNGATAQRITSESEKSITSYFWSGDDELFYRKGRYFDDSLQLFVVNRTTRVTRNLLLPSKLKLRLITPHKVKNNQLLISLNERDSSVFDVYRLNIETMNRDLIARNPGNVVNWFADVDGQVRLAVASDSVQETMLYRETERHAFKAITSSSFKSSIKPIGFCGKNPHVVFALSNVGRDKLALVEYDLLKGIETKVIYEHPDVDVSQGGYLYDKGEMAYASYTTWKQQYHFLNERTEHVVTNVGKLLPGFEINILDRDTARNRFILSTYTDRNPGATYHYDLKENSLTKLSDNNRALEHYELAEMKPVSYPARDGVEIHGYLTLPVNSNGKNVPLIVYPHNGPGTRIYWRFDPDVQFLVNRGYAVFQPNYRGSVGYGKIFRTAGFKEWGDKIQHDIADGVRWLIAEGIADPKRVGIYGEGFGGYSALQSASLYPDLYQCAASYSGFTNLFTYLREVPPTVKPYLQMYYEMIGHPELEADLLKQMSPVFRSDQINVPVFIAQGGKDGWSSLNETNEFVRKLRVRNIPITYILREEEGRYFQRQDNRIGFYTDLAVFFEKHLK